MYLLALESAWLVAVPATNVGSKRESEARQWPGEKLSHLRFPKDGTLNGRDTLDTAFSFGLAKDS